MTSYLSGPDELKASTGEGAGDRMIDRNDRQPVVSRTPAARCSQARRTVSARLGFTLTELLVVIGILALVAAIALPAMGPMFKSNRTAATMDILNGMLVTARTTAQAQGTPVGIRIERAMNVDPMTGLVDTSGQIYQDHQQARLVRFASSRDQAFKYIPDSRVFTFPKEIWLTPGYALVMPSLSAAAAEHSPHPSALSYSRLETFFIVFNGAGELVRFPAASNYYVDESQLDGSDNALWLEHPDDSALHVLLYERERWENLSDSSPADQNADRKDFLRREAMPVYVNRITGEIVGGEQQ